MGILSADAGLRAGTEPRSSSCFSHIVVVEPRMRALYETVRKVAPRGLPVLITGETGSGKEVVARALHAESGRPGKLLSVNCATIPRELTESLLFGYEKGAFTGAAHRTEGLFERARGGTVFLDEIGELGLGAQAALLRVLQERRLSRVGAWDEIEVDVRVVAATHRDLRALASAGAFREDLFYRLNVIRLDIPPLRERLLEIRPLAQSFLDDAARRWGGVAPELGTSALRRFEAYPWPGNVRELRNVVEGTAVLCEGGTIEEPDLPPELRGLPVDPSMMEAPRTEQEAWRTHDGAVGSIDFRAAVRAYETSLIQGALVEADGNVARAAALLNLPRRTLGHKMRLYGVGRVERSAPAPSEPPESVLRDAGERLPGLGQALAGRRQ